MSAQQHRSAIAAIGWVSYTTWRRELRAALSLSQRSSRILLATIAVSGVALGFALAALTSQSLGGQHVPPEVLDAVALSSASGLCLTASLVAVVVNLVAPRETTLQTLLDLLPVPRSSAALGAHFPTMMVGASAGAVLSIPTIWLAATSTGDPVLALSLCIAVVLCCCALNVLICTWFAAMRRVAARWLKLPQHIALAAAGGTAILACLAAFGPTVLTDGLRPDAQITGWLWATPQGLIAACIRGSWWTWLAVIGALVVWCLGSLVLFALYFSGRMERAPGPARRLRILSGFPVPRHRFFGLVYIDVLTLLRAPQFIVTALLVPTGAVAARLAKSYGLPAEVSSATAGVLLIAGMVLVGQSTGVALPTRWVVRATVGAGAEWVAVKAVATALVHLVIATAASMLLLLLGVPLGDGAVSTSETVMLAWASALLGGALAPYDERHTLSPGVTLAVSALLYSVSSLTVTSSPLPEGSLPVLATLVVGLVFVVVYFSICVRLDEREPARA